MDVSKVQIGEITTLEVEFPDQVCVLGLRNTSTDPKKVQFQISKDLNVVASAFRCTPR